MKSGRPLLTSRTLVKNSVVNVDFAERWGVWSAYPLLCGPSFNTQLIRDQARGSTISEFCTCPPRQGQRERERDEEETEEAKLGPREAEDRSGRGGGRGGVRE